MLTAPRPLTAESLAQRIGDVLRVLLAERRNGVKHLARRIWADHRAVENWQGGRCAPRSAELIRLMAAEPAVKAEVLRMVEDEAQAMRSAALAARQQERRLLGARLDEYADLLGEADATNCMGAGESLAVGGARL
jgi:hypothetical protein